MRKSKTYENYKPSGVQWLGDVPEHWGTGKFGRNAFFQEGPGLRNWQFMDEGIRVICVTNITEKGIDFSDYTKFISEKEYWQSYRHFTVTKGDLLLSSSGNSWGKVAEFTSDELAILNTSTIRVNENPEKALCRPFIRWLLESVSIREQLGLFMTGSCQPNFGPSHLTRVLVTLPPLAEQEDIADFLAQETGKIDTLVEKKKRLVELLKEKRTALISHAVTKGLNPKAKMKYSGVKWLGDVPEHWDVKRLKYLSNIRYGIGEPPEYVDEGIPLIRATNINAGKIESANLVQVNPDDIPAGRIIWLKAGDIIVVRSGAYTGDSSIIPEEYNGAIAGFDMVLSSTKANSNFLAYSLLSKYLKEGQLDQEKMRAAQPHLNAEELGNCIIFLPPLTEQQAIAEFIDQETGKIDRLIARVEGVIEKLKEYRTALISAAVTGKIDVRRSIN